MSKTVFCELPSFGLIRFAGDDAQAFLHNQLSCDVAALALARSTYGGYCSPKGRMLASLLIWRSEQGLFVQLPASLRDGIQKQLARYILRSRVRATDASGDWAVIGVAGTDAHALAQKVGGSALAAEHDIAHASGMTLIRLPADRYEIIAPKDGAPRLIKLLSEAATKAAPEYWEWLDIRAGVPWILPATQEEFVPQMLNLDLIGGVSFQKGCYPGQEIVARMHYRGTLKQRMYRANISGVDRPQPGDKLFSPEFGEQACGAIVNAARSPEGGHDVLASIQTASAGKGDVRWKSLEGPGLQFLPLPYAVSGDR